ncbi:MAG: class I SAM-dependent methyltransferase [Spirochaetes bacterium]|nr:class I SAM-dependent methyltransferase [Spirochaetota bacterium]
MAPMEARWIASLRSWIIPKAKGTVLEVGTGTGANLPYYRMNQVQSLILTDRKEWDSKLQRILWARLRSIPGYSAIRCQEAEVEALPFSNERFDTVVATLLLCSVENPLRAIEEMYRVLRVGGQFLFIEHMRPVSPALASLFDRVTPAWRRIASGCHLNRDTLKTIKEGGFSILEMKRLGDSVFCGGVARKV